MPDVQLNVGENRQNNPSNCLTVANHNKHHNVDQIYEETINNHHLQMVLNKDAIYKFVYFFFSFDMIMLFK